MPRLLRPRALPEGGTVGLAAPASPVDATRVAAGVARLRACGYRVVQRRDLLARRGYLAGDDRRRVEELRQLIEDPSVDAILCVRGGYGCHRIVSELDPAAVRRARKPIVGYSDVTTLLLWLRRRAGLVGFHGPMLERGDGRGELTGMLAAIGGREPLPIVWRGSEGEGGAAAGRLTGGSLTLVAASLGTPWEVETRGAILLLEEVGEPAYRIDRMLAQLAAAGKLAQAAAIGFGHLHRCGGDRPASARGVVRQWLRRSGRPWVIGLPFGHGRPNRPWPLGARARLEGRRARLAILEHGVVPAARGWSARR